MITEFTKILTYVLHFNHSMLAMQGTIDSLWRGRGDPDDNSLQLLSTRTDCSLFTDDRIRLLALLLKTNALYKAHVDPHQSIYPPILPPVHLYFLSIPIYPVILQERKKEKGSFGREAHPCVWTQFCRKTLFLPTLPSA